MTKYKIQMIKYKKELLEHLEGSFKQNTRQENGLMTIELKERDVKLIINLIRNEGVDIQDVYNKVITCLSDDEQQDLILLLKEKGVDF